MDGFGISGWWWGLGMFTDGGGKTWTWGRDMED